MKIKLDTIKVENYYSIGTVEYKFKNGVHLVYGVNYDLTDTFGKAASNGAGKTTLFSAVYQGLFNKNSKNPSDTVTTASNIYTEKPYRIVLDLEIDETEYRIDNNRGKGKIEIFENSKDITPKNISSQLRRIQNILKLDFKAFSALTFFNPASLTSIMDLTSKENLLYKFLDIESVKHIEQNVKKYLKEQKEEIKVLSAKKTLLENQKKNLERALQNTVDKEKLKEELIDIENKIATYKQSNLVKLLELKKEDMENAAKSLAKAKTKLEGIVGEGKVIARQREQLKSGTCPVCGNKVNTDALEDEYRIVSDKYDKQKEIVDKKQAEFEKIEEEYLQLKRKYDEGFKQLTEKRTAIFSKLNMADSFQELTENVQAQTDDLQKQIEETEKAIKEIEPYINYFEAVDGLLKDGVLLSFLLQSYTKHFIKWYNHYKSLAGVPISVALNINKGKLDYWFYEDGKKKTYNALSMGEKTRVSLLFLVATLKAIEEVSGFSINYLVFDEILGSLDEHGVEVLKILLDDLRKDKAIFLINHHEEIEKAFADSVITIAKRNNISYLEGVENDE